MPIVPHPECRGVWHLPDVLDLYPGRPCVLYTRASGAGTALAKVKLEFKAYGAAAQVEALTGEVYVAEVFYRIEEGHFYQRRLMLEQAARSVGVLSLTEVMIAKP